MSSSVGPRVVLILLAVLAAGGQVSCGPATDLSAADCGQPTMTSRPREFHDPRNGPAGGAGSASVPGRLAPPPAPASPPLPPPEPVNGRVALTAANAGQTIVVPAGTVIEVRLEPVSGSMWTVPESFDPQALPRLSASIDCDAVKAATFRAVSTSGIVATRPHGDAQAQLIVTVRVTG
jgi:hypothetical protein